jgi:hypothetical protein
VSSPHVLTWMLLVVGVLVVLRLVLMLVVAVGPTAVGPGRLLVGIAGHRARVGDRPGLQREGELRGHRTVAGGR